MHAVDTLQARQAALLVHGLSPDSRNRVIDRLGVAELSRLQPLLIELGELGVSQDAGRLLEASGVWGPHGDSTLPARDRVAAMDPSNVAHRLRHCAPATVACLLNVFPGIWRKAVIDRLSEARRIEVARCLFEGPARLSPAMIDALCERVLSTRADTDPDAVLGHLAPTVRSNVTGRSEPQSLWKTCVEGLHRWTR